MKRTVCELFAGVGGFRCGLNHIHSLDFRKEKWDTVWYSQWEPADKKTQWAHGCYKQHFGTCLDLDGKDTTNIDIHLVDKSKIPEHSLLVGGFPCQNYSVASSLKTSKGIEGDKGVLWWDIRAVLEAKNPPFVLLENVDRLVKSPAKQRGRDFGIILACFRDLGYDVEWRIINAADYGMQQRRRRTFIFAYKSSSNYARALAKKPAQIISSVGLFAKAFPVSLDETSIRSITLSQNLGDVSDKFEFSFDVAGYMSNGIIYSANVSPIYKGKTITLGDILDDNVPIECFIPKKKLYYTNPSVTHSDETDGLYPEEMRRTWQYIKGAKKYWRKSSDGHEYIYSEGAMPMIDAWDKPARTLLTSEGGFSRMTHIVYDKATSRLRLLTPTECERIQGFPSNWTKESLVGDSVVAMPVRKRKFMMGNALVVNLVEKIEPVLSNIIEKE